MRKEKITRPAKTSAAPPNPRSTIGDLAQLVLRCLMEGTVVDIEGLGAFKPDGEGGYLFLGETKPQVFLAYAAEDLPIAAARLPCGPVPWGSTESGRVGW